MKLYTKEMKRKTLQLSMAFLLFLILINTTNLSKTVNSNYSTIPLSNDIYNLTTNEKKLIEEFSIYNDTEQLATGSFPITSILRLNITVLPQSNASVYIFHEKITTNETSPALVNITLAPGESFEETYTLLGSVSEYEAIVYFAQCKPGNATVLWWYDLQYSARPPQLIGITFPSISCSLLLTFAVITLVTKRNK